MQVFKTMLKLLKKQLPMVIMYFTVFTALAFGVAASISSTSEDNGFAVTKSKIAIINEDTASPLNDAFVAYMGQSNQIVEVDNNQKSIDDALFFRRVSCVIVIPSGFSQSFVDGGEVGLDMRAVPDSQDQVFINMLATNYLSCVKAYITHSTLPLSQVLSQVKLDLESAPPTEFIPENTSEFRGINQAFNTLAYGIFCIVFFIIVPLMIAFNAKKVKRRNLIGAMPQGKHALIRYSALAAIVAIAFIMYTVAVLIYGGAIMFSLKGLMLILNMLTFFIVCVSLSFMFGAILKSDLAVSGVMNVLGLGMAFVSGAFVPQSMLGAGTLVFARFMPMYWFVSNTNNISPVINFTASSITPFVCNILIMLGFAVVFVLGTLLIVKSRRAKK